MDSFQGQEAPVAIHSLTASSGDDAPRGVGFLLEPNRLNVAISRAQCLSIVVGSPGLASGVANTVAAAQALGRLYKVISRSIYSLFKLTLQNAKNVLHSDNKQDDRREELSGQSPIYLLKI